MISLFSRFKIRVCTHFPLFLNELIYVNISHRKVTCLLLDDKS